VRYDLLLVDEFQPASGSSAGGNDAGDLSPSVAALMFQPASGSSAGGNEKIEDWDGSGHGVSTRLRLIRRRKLP